MERLDYLYNPRIDNYIKFKKGIELKISKKSIRAKDLKKANLEIEASLKSIENMEMYKEMMFELENIEVPKNEAITSFTELNKLCCVFIENKAITSFRVYENINFKGRSP